MSRTAQPCDGPRLRELAATVLLAASGFVFVSLVVANYLVFSSNEVAQHLGTDLLIPIYSLSVYVLRVSPFDEGLWAFGAFCVLLSSLTMLRAGRRGTKNSILDSLTVIGPAILISFEVGVYFLIPAYFYRQVTNFTESVGLGGLITNIFVLVLSAVVLSTRLLVNKFLSERGNVS